MLSEIKVIDKKFELLINEKEIKKVVKKIANQINRDYKNEEVIFIPILNGAFIFAADLIRHIKIKNKITFLKLQSYIGERSSGKVRKLIGLTEDIKNKKVIVIEDIVDTGETLVKLLELLKKYEPAEIKVVTLLLKTENYIKKQKIDYIGFKVPSRYIVGYGLDYSGYARNLSSIYIEKL
ncbi:MAG: hypoxanthine phosphoribosyltransferase [Bacteroidales bacterium]|nr:hypoxanthine phosphoribosyltransferase [Bacteroidales bacterium]